MTSTAAIAPPRPTRVVRAAEWVVRVLSYELGDSSAEHADARDLRRDLAELLLRQHWV